MLNWPPASVTKRKKDKVLPHIRWETVVGTTSVWEKGGGRQKQSKLFAYDYSTLSALETIVGVVTWEQYVWVTEKYTGDWINNIISEAVFRSAQVQIVARILLFNLMSKELEMFLQSFTHFWTILHSFRHFWAIVTGLNCCALEFIFHLCLLGPSNKCLKHLPPFRFSRP